MSGLVAISKEEVHFYYRGLPSAPLLVARTGTIPYEPPTGPEAYPVRKALRVVGNHHINDIWEDNLAFKVHAVLDQNNVDWTSTDVVRIGCVNQLSAFNVILWIGVKPRSLPYAQAIDVALQCKMLLLDYGIHDVDVEIRESELIRSAGPHLFPPTDSYDDPAVDVREPFTATVGIPVCAQSAPDAQGTGGFFLQDDGDPSRLFLVTARHAVLPQTDNNPIEHKPQCEHRHDVLIFSEAAFQTHLTLIQQDIRAQGFEIDYFKRCLERLTGMEDARAVTAREHAQRSLKKAEEASEALTAIHQELSTHWATDSSRILGHILFSPPLAVGVGTEQYAQDVAVIEIDTSKIDPASFAGNAIELGDKIPFVDLIRMMNPSRAKPSPFKYPVMDRLLNLRGTIPDDELRHPTTYDENDAPCIMVIKRGGATGVTVGRANNVFSYARNHFGDNGAAVSKQWVVLPYKSDPGSFFEKGDSGSVVVDGAGRIGGLLTSGCGSAKSFDLAYVTPIGFVLKTIHSNESLAKTRIKSRPEYQ